VKVKQKEKETIDKYKIEIRDLDNQQLQLANRHQHPQTPC
jgi:hypothetical protein